jgi:HlyD family secretion protein
MDEENNIELRSEEFQEVLGAVPPWILRWGITVLAVIIVILLAGSAIFKYPDVLSSQVVLTGSTPPAVVVAHASGKLKELHVSDNQEVKAGTYLAVIDNPARTEDILRLKDHLSSDQFATLIQSVTQPDYPLSIVNYQLLTDLRLGSLQSSYSALRTALHEYSEYRRLTYYPQKIAMTMERKAQYERQYATLLNQQRLTEEQLDIARNRFRRDSLLNVRDMISDEELENSRSAYLQSLLTCENIQSSLNNMQIQIGQLEESLLDTNQRDIETLNGLYTRIQTLLSQLQTEVRNWELNYVLQAPIDGTVTFTNYWVENQNVVAGGAVFTIVPEGAMPMIGKAMLPVARSGKVQIGQKVNIRLQNFPENEYGILRGTVQNISLAPVQEGGMAYYSVEITLNDGLMTTYKKELPQLTEMLGQADIITEDLSLLQRLVLPLKKVLSESL